jgi:hypothetical protein
VFIGIDTGSEQLLTRVSKPLRGFLHSTTVFRCHTVATSHPEVAENPWITSGPWNHGSEKRDRRYFLDGGRIEEVHAAPGARFIGWELLGILRSVSKYWDAALPRLAMRRKKTGGAVSD